MENICEDAPMPIVEDTLLSLPMAPARKPSPSHSISSSSSGSYFNGKKSVASTSPRNSVAMPSAGTVAAAMKHDLASDGEKSEKRHSSSGYYESPHEDGMFFVNFSQYSSILMRELFRQIPVVREDSEIGTKMNDANVKRKCVWMFVPQSHQRLQRKRRDYVSNVFLPMIGQRCMYWMEPVIQSLNEIARKRDGIQIGFVNTFDLNINEYIFIIPF